MGILDESDLDSETFIALEPLTEHFTNLHRELECSQMES